MTVRIAPAPPDFDDWTGLHKLLTGAFSYMEGRIDPPSSLNRLTPTSLAQKARSEILLLGRDGGRPVVCAFCAPRPPILYLSKIAVAPDCRGRGMLRLVLDRADRIARDHGLDMIELQTRIELTENHDRFRAMGFERFEETTHPGYTRPTSVTFRRPVVA
ncbi:acetyltransferase (GNAT) family protein [Palleronia aestuarii]|uniref:Acetyltransferase (GNAT) family protein n=1 Tax=Palleronia aestuarii TaxID=568105 RepID=A0A2W7P6T4_9RHOB|nr:GNAT family N-acetyltransferase [Palleronia aestuarii]PZX19102.1 acetyltransferase (GNAT) family protein [Palleronia aestuarii]